MKLMGRNGLIYNLLGLAIYFLFPIILLIYIPIAGIYKILTGRTL